MANKLELVWVGKDTPIQPEPRILLEDRAKSYGDINAENMLIHGDNLLALKALESKYAGQVKCIYIDPPYNTGSAFEHYDDNLEHSTWLSLMRPRLEILKNLLTTDGSIWITLDDNEAHYCKVMCDEIFGRKHFIADVIWNSRKSVSNDAILSLNTNHILVYAKDIESIRSLAKKSILFKGKSDESKFENPDNDPLGPWVADPFDAPNIRPNLTYPIINPLTGSQHLPPSGRHWRITQERFASALAEGRIIFGKNGKSKPQMKRYLSEAVEKGQVMTTLWDDLDTTTNATKHSQALFGNNAFTNPKPENLIERVFDLGSNPDDLVLDSFLGSGTTAAVAHKMGRRWIGIEMGDHAYTHCKVRLDKVIDGTDEDGITESVGWAGGGGYRFYELAPTLIKTDKLGTAIINPEYNAEMLAATVAKHEGFEYAPDSTVFWKQARFENSYLFTTTRHITVEYLSQIADELQDGEHLVIAAKSFEDGVNRLNKNIKVKKIPPMLLGRCEYGREHYNLNIISISETEDDDE